MTDLLIPPSQSGQDLPGSQSADATQTGGAVGDHTSDEGQTRSDAPLTTALVGLDAPAVKAETTSNGPSPQGAMLDPTLLMAAQIVDDLERARIANENRLRTFTTQEPDEDGVMRGFGLDITHPDVARLQAITDGLAKLEHEAVLNLQRAMRRHPLHGWVKRTPGVGEKQAARLLAAVGDPYWNTLYDRPRTVSELWAYSGYHTVPAGQGSADIPMNFAGGDQDPTGGDTQGQGDTHLEIRVAARRRKGQKANWSTQAKMRAYLIAESCLKQENSPYRKVYLERREHTAITHPEWTKGHSHNDALHVAAKEILKHMWRESKAAHGVVDVEPT